MRSSLETVIAKEKSLTLPQGYRLLGVEISKTNPRAYCLWEVESRDGLEKLLESFKLPSTFVIDEFRIKYSSDEDTMNLERML